MRVSVALTLAFGIVVAGLAFGVASRLPIAAALDVEAARSWTIAIALVAVGVVLVIIAVAAGVQFPTTYVPALWAIAPLVPGLAAICVVAAYLVVPGGSSTRFFVGIEIAGAIAILAAIPLRIIATVRVAQTRSYWELRRRSEQLGERLSRIEASGSPGGKDGAPGAWSTAQNMALQEAREQLNAVKEALFAEPSQSLTNGLEWVSAMGYVSLWRRVDRAEEALIEIEPCDLVLGDALHDQLRLAGAGIKSGQMEVALATAVMAIDAAAYRRYFAPAPHAGSPEATSVTAIQARLRAAGENTETSGCQEGDGAARAVLREIRYAINAYVEDTMESIVRARNRLWRAILLTATVVFLLVGLAVLNSVDRGQLIAASVFFLVAATVGLFNRLRLQAKADSAVEDFNLFEARLVHTPLVSGIAGVAGVVLVALAPAAGGQPTMSLGNAFDLGHNVLGTLVAAAFGLAPDRIIGPLQDQTERLKQQLNAGKAAVAVTSASNAADGSTARVEGSP